MVYNNNFNISENFENKESLIQKRMGLVKEGCNNVYLFTYRVL